MGILGTIKGIGQGLFGTNKGDPALHAQLPYFEQDRAALGRQLQGRSPFAGQEWGGLVSQLQQQASGQGPSVGEQAYRRAAGDTTAALMSMSHGSASPAAAREAMLQRARVGQGMASGLAQARTNEQLGAYSALGSALGQRDQLNQNAYLQTLAARLGLSEGQLKAMLGNQSYEAAMAAQPTGLQRGLGALGGFASGIASL